MALADAQAQFGFRAAGREGAGPAGRAGEAPAILEHGAAEGHVGAQEAAHRNAAGRHPLIAAAHHPVKLGGKPRRPAVLPVRSDHAADAEHAGILVVAGHRGEPAGIGCRAIAEESDDIALGYRHAGITRAWQARLEAVRGDDDGPRQELGQELGLRQQLRAVVDDQDYLVRRLRADGDDGLLQLFPSVDGAGADDYRNGRPERRLPSRGRVRRAAAIRLVALAGIGPDKGHRRGFPGPAGGRHGRGYCRRHPGRL